MTWPLIQPSLRDLFNRDFKPTLERVGYSRISLRETPILLSWNSEKMSKLQGRVQLCATAQRAPTTSGCTGSARGCFSRHSGQDFLVRVKFGPAINTTATFRSYACEGVVLISDVRASIALGPRLHRRSYEASVAVVLTAFRG